MTFRITPDTPVTVREDGIVIVSGPGGCPWVTDPAVPHLGGNFDGGDLGTMYPEDLWPWLLDTLQPKTFADVGCGTGETLRWFREHGCEAFGIEGLPWNAARAAERAAAPVRVHDLQAGPAIFDPVDLLWCSDVAEHIEERYLPHLLATLSQCRVLAMCQGTEKNGDDGWHHVNNQTEDYWIRALASVGMIEDEEATKEARRVGSHGWWVVTGRIYRKAGG